MLATLVSVEGSSYRKPGARLLWLPEGVRAGSISGGCLEEDLLERARIGRRGAARVVRRAPTPSPAVTLSAVVNAATPLSSHTNSTGSFHSAARFIDSWNAPSATAPSPKKHAVTRRSSRRRSAQLATPASVGSASPASSAG